MQNQRPDRQVLPVFEIQHGARTKGSASDAKLLHRSDEDYARRAKGLPPVLVRFPLRLCKLASRARHPTQEHDPGCLPKVDFTAEPTFAGSQG